MLRTCRGNYDNARQPPIRMTDELGDLASDASKSYKSKWVGCGDACDRVCITTDSWVSRWLSHHLCIRYYPTSPT